jgi:hypothetical protein
MTPAELAERLIGTCEHVDIEDELGTDVKVLTEFDSLVFLCEGCGWWCGMEEANDAHGGFVCEECCDEE